LQSLQPKDLIEPHSDANVTAQAHPPGHQRQLRIELLVDDPLEVLQRNGNRDVRILILVVDWLGTDLPSI